MVRQSRFVCTLLRMVLFATLTRLFSLAGIRIGHIVGSPASFFSGGSVMTPLAGVFGSVWECAFISLVNAVLVLWQGTMLHGLHVTTYGVPSFFAALYWARPSFWTRFFVPAACVFLFWASPIGFAAFPYALYWFIPMMLYLFGAEAVYFNALGSTFVAHAVGSVISLYVQPQTAAIWRALIPTVAWERLLIAGWMVLVYTAAYFGYCAWQRWGRDFMCRLGASEGVADQ